MPAAKAKDVIAVTPTLTDAASALLQGFRKHLLHITGDADRDLDEVELQTDHTGHMFLGSWHNRLRLITGFRLTPAKEADVVIISTKGQREADAALLGVVGPDIGNSILVARLLHVAVFYLRAVGVSAIINDPYDSRVRGLYQTMGFANGERLSLDDLAALTTLFQYVQQHYHHHSLSRPIPLSVPPLPL